MHLRHLARSAAALSLVLASPALADRDTAQFTSLTVFGDSLVDAGNVNALNPNFANAAQGYFDGRFTNGYNYPDLLSIALYGTPTVASLEGGTNFAFGGARATSTTALPDLGEQLAFFQNYLAAGNAVDPNGLYILNFGGNDIFGAAQPGVPAGFASDDAFLRSAAQTYAAGIQSLADLGARNFLVTGFPNSATPTQFALSQQAQVYLLSEIGKLNLDTDVSLYLFDYLAFFTELRADPTRFGLPADINFTTTCQQARATPGCEGFFSFDGTHPTAAVQAAAFQAMDAQFNLTAAVPEPGTWALMLLGFGAVGWAMRRGNGRPRTRAQVRFAFAR